MSQVDERVRLQTRSWFSVVRAYQACERQYARLLEQFALTIPQFDVLSAIDELGDEATPARIAERLVVTKGNITGLLKRLTDQRLVLMSPNPVDGRSQRCRLGSGVAARLAAARQAAAVFVNQQLAPFSDDELKATEVQMARMCESLERMDVLAIANAIPQPRSKRRA